MNDLSMTGQTQNNGGQVQSTAPAGFLGGLDMTTIGAIVVLASAFMRR
tara:strand:+ start:599 stop:742 length:144 start_codon:yes stop_codon:yes gene_type:complete